MKKVFAIAFLLIAFPLFALDVNIGEKVTSSDATEVTVNLVGLIPSTASTHLVFIHVDAGNSGTIQFAVGRAIDASDNAWPAGSKVPMTVQNRSKPLHFKASGASQSFVITQ